MEREEGIWKSLEGLAASPAKLAVQNLGYNAGGWRVEKHPHFVDLTSNKCADIIGFGKNGHWNMGFI